jgi:hypothetical protein
MLRITPLSIVRFAYSITVMTKLRPTGRRVDGNFGEKDE